MAQFIAHELIDWFLKSEEPVTSALITEELTRLHKQSYEEFRGDSASYAILLIESRTSAVSLHAGDCLIGEQRQPDSITWLAQPHTLANAIDDMPVAEIAATALRNRLTRSFRQGAFMCPETNSIDIDGATNLILATDGFWAGLAPEKQLRELSGDYPRSSLLDDDCSALFVRFEDDTDGVRIVDDTPENLYFAVAK